MCLSVCSSFNLIFTQNSLLFFPNCGLPWAKVLLSPPLQFNYMLDVAKTSLKYFFKRKSVLFSITVIHTVVLFLLCCFSNDSGLHNWPKFHFPLNNRRPLMSFLSSPCSTASVKSHPHASGCFFVYQPEFEKVPQKNKPCVSGFRVPPLE